MRNCTWLGEGSSLRFPSIFVLTTKPGDPRQVLRCDPFQKMAWLLRSRATLPASQRRPSSPFHIDIQVYNEISLKMSPPVIERQFPASLMQSCLCLVPLGSTCLQQERERRSDERGALSPAILPGSPCLTLRPKYVSY